MSGWSLRWKERPAGPAAVIDGSGLRPDRLGTLAWKDVQSAKILVGRLERRLEEIFEISPLGFLEEGPGLEVEGSTRMVRLGEGMAHGVLKVRGDAGSIQGLLGGEVLVSGNAGPEVGLGQRSGLIAVAGRVDGFVGRHLRAGTILVSQGELELPGLGMRRGTILALGGKPRLASGFERDGIVCPTWLRLLARRLGALGFDGAHEFNSLLESGHPLESWSGDHLSLGRGEVLFPA